MQGFRKRTPAALIAAAMMMLGLGAGSAQAYPQYDNGGVGCVSCHSDFQGGGGAPLHASHVYNLNIAVGDLNTTSRCNVCHSAGQGSTIYTMGSNTAGGDGLGCMGCHGQDYGETAFTAPYNGKPKASGYGLRLVHANAGVAICASCHAPNPHPVLDETVRPPYYLMRVSDLRNSCDSAQEDLPFDGDSIGLDNDGDGDADYPADAACFAAGVPTTTTSTTTTTTTTLPVTCGLSPMGSCTPGAKAKLSISEKSAGKEKVKFQVSKLLPAVVRADFGAPVTSDTSYALCLYNGSNTLVGSYEVARGSENCGTDPCWENFKDAGYAYADKDLQTADGVSKIQLAGGVAGKGKVLLQASNKASTMPTGIAAVLSGATSATVQLVNGDGDCFGMALPTVKKADGLSFSAAAP